MEAQCACIFLRLVSACVVWCVLCVVCFEPRVVHRCFVDVKVCFLLILCVAGAHCAPSIVQRICTELVWLLYSGNEIELLLPLLQRFSQ